MAVTRKTEETKPQIGRITFGAGGGALSVKKEEQPRGSISRTVKLIGEPTERSQAEQPPVETKLHTAKPAKVRTIPRTVFHCVEVHMWMQGLLHATSPSTTSGINYALAKNEPSPTVLAARREAGEPIIPTEELAGQIAEEVGAVEAKNGPAVFHKDKDGVPFLHRNFLKGHMRACGDASSRMLGFYALQDFINRTLFIGPDRTYLYSVEGKLYTGKDVKIEEWPTHFDVYRVGRLSGFRQAEILEDPQFSFRLYLLADPRWSSELVKALLDYGTVRGIGGGRGRHQGQYRFTLGEITQVSQEEVWQDQVQKPGLTLDVLT